MLAPHPVCVYVYIMHVGVFAGGGGGGGGGGGSRMVGRVHVHSPKAHALTQNMPL